jgi:predicted TIM-barrel fold metal-dependent hydrolase
MRINRRQWIEAIGLSSFAGASTAKGNTAPPSAAKPLNLLDYQPKSMLHVPVTRAERARFPVIDAHVHVSFLPSHLAFPPKIGDKLVYSAPPEELLHVMERKNIRMLVNLTGGVGENTRDCVQKYDAKYPGRFFTFTEPFYARINEPGYPRFQADAMQQAKQDGARGLKVIKALGLALRDTSGRLIKVDDKRFDPMWAACGDLGMPVAIHISDPSAFFLPIDRFNERYENLSMFPSWSFYGKDFPSNAELLEARNRMFARHPRTQFLALHVGHFAENLAHVSDSMDQFPNMYVELGARIAELGRQPRTARKFFEKHQDRILFGTDAIPRGYEIPQQVFSDALYEIYFRFLETEDEYFDYEPTPAPRDGRWCIYGLGLPEAILRKVYYENAARFLKVAE